MKNKSLHTTIVKQTAASLGFEFCGIARAKKLEEDAKRLEQWLQKGMHAGMHYMENHFDLRVDPAKLVPGARSVITLMLNYYPSAKQNPQSPKVSKYAYGKDYHDVIRIKLRTFLQLLNEKIGQINGRGFVDSAPVLERSWARQSGLGWVGKNGNLINKKAGSFYFLATLITDLDLDFDDPVAKDYCGSCTKCIDSCPTDAILPGKTIDAGKCISYFTIELKENSISTDMKGKFANWMFGCDICQDVCPWNRFAKPSGETEFSPIPELINMSANEWEEMNEESFKKIFKESPLKRAKFGGIKRNIQFLKK